MQHTTLARLAAPLVGAALVAGSLAAPAVAADRGPLTPGAAQVDPSGRAEAEALLDQVLALSRGRDAKRAPSRRVDLTLLLLRLGLQRDLLAPADRARVDALLARPTDTGGDGTLDYAGTPEATPLCGPHVCVHYVASSVNATDPGQAQATLDEMEHVWDVYKAAGYRAPKSDGTVGGSGKFDVYLGEIADQLLYGYCTIDPGKITKTEAAYCVLDNDYAGFPEHTPLENMQVTAAHEFFHAIQFNYDVLEDPWFMEVSSTWAEDELYPSINDNLQYLPRGQLGGGFRLPLDYFENGGVYHYGNWIWMRFLTERFPKKSGGLPVIVRQMWDKAGAQMYSIQAIGSVLSAKKTSFTREYAAFAAQNRYARTFYREGAAQGYPQTRAFRTVQLRAKATTSWIAAKLYHQSSVSIRALPKNVGATGRLVVTVNGPNAAHDPAFVVDRVSAKGKHSLKLVRLDKRGDGTLTVPFASSTTQEVMVTMVNTGTAYTKCSRTNPHTWLACGDYPLDDGKYKVRLATVKR